MREISSSTNCERYEVPSIWSDICVTKLDRWADMAPCVISHAYIGKTINEQGPYTTMDEGCHNNYSGNM
jgi:hypothetical protein